MQLAGSPTICPALGTLSPIDGIPPMGSEFVNLDYETFGVMYRAFNKVICGEVPADPRKSCD